MAQDAETGRHVYSTRSFLAKTLQIISDFFREKQGVSFMS